MVFKLYFRVVRVKLYQAFLLSGGANGRIWRGDELLEMEFMGAEDEDQESNGTGAMGCFDW